MKEPSIAEKLDIYKNHCVDEKLCFHNFIVKNLKLLENNEIYLRYIAYIDDIILYFRNM